MLLQYNRKGVQDALLLVTIVILAATTYAQQQCTVNDDISCFRSKGACNQDAPLKSLQAGVPVRDDTIGQLIANQVCV